MNKIKKLVRPDFPGEIIHAVRSSTCPAQILNRICTYHEKDIASALTLLSPEEQRSLCHMLPATDLAEIFSYMECPAPFFSCLDRPRQLELLSHMDAHTAAALLAQLPEDFCFSLIHGLSPERRNEIRMIQSFSHNNIGSRMSTNFIAIPTTATVKEAMSQLIRNAETKENISTLFVVDDHNVFAGGIDLKDLIIARDGTPLSDITMLSYPFLYAHTETEACIPMLREYSECAIPVLDQENRLIGVVTAQDFAEILDDELGDDYAKLAGLSSGEDLSESVLCSVKKRLPWLCILLVMGMGVSATVGMFEALVAQLPVIMCFQSLILDMAGNVGTQSLAVAIRVLMDDNVKKRHRVTLVWKEIRIGLLNGSILGALSVTAIGGYLMLKGNAPAFSFAVSGCLGLAMILAMLVSSMSGTLIPIFFKRIGIDPAVASGPLITTVNDLVAVITYYSLSWVILIQCMHF